MRLCKSVSAKYYFFTIIREGCAASSIRGGRSSAYGSRKRQTILLLRRGLFATTIASAEISISSSRRRRCWPLLLITISLMHLILCTAPTRTRRRDGGYMHAAGLARA